MATKRAEDQNHTVRRQLECVLEPTKQGALDRHAHLADTVENRSGTSSLPQARPGVLGVHDNLIVSAYLAA